MKIRSYLLAVLSIIALTPSISSATDFSYNIDLSGGSVTQSNPRSNGYISSATENSITLVGPNNNFYYPNLVSSINIVASPSTSGGASAYLTNNPLQTSRYLGTVLDHYDAYANINFLTQSDMTYLAGLGAPTNQFISDKKSGAVLEFSYQYYEVRTSYDYSFTSSDLPGLDYASGVAGLNLNVPSSGHVDSLISTLTNFSGNFQLSLNNSTTFNPPTSFNWSVGSVDNLGGAGNLTISNLTVSLIPEQGIFYISNVPESDTYSMLLVGLGVMGFMARYKQS